MKLASAKRFVKTFFQILAEQKTSQKLIRYIRDHTSCFGPKRLGSNLLINKFSDKSKSFFQVIQSLVGEKILPELENLKQEKIE